jgi:hypothetical protein
LLLNSPEALLSGMNRFLQTLEITFRRDPTNFRPRINKMDSVKDKEQKLSGEFNALFGSTVCFPFEEVDTDRTVVVVLSVLRPQVTSSSSNKYPNFPPHAYHRVPIQEPTSSRYIPGHLIIIYLLFRPAFYFTLISWFGFFLI